MSIPRPRGFITAGPPARSNEKEYYKIATMIDLGGGFKTTVSTASTWDEVLTLSEETTGRIRNSERAQAQLTTRGSYSAHSELGHAIFIAEIVDRPRRQTF